MIWGPSVDLFFLMPTANAEGLRRVHRWHRNGLDETQRQVHSDPRGPSAFAVGMLRDRKKGETERTALGGGEHDWNPMPCAPLLTPDEIPEGNLTSPLWPRSFSVDEMASLTFPGRDPCKIDFRHAC